MRHQKSRKFNGANRILIFTIFLLLALAFACQNGRQISNSKVEKIVFRDSISRVLVPVRHDSLIFIKDESSFRALLECDSLGNVLMTELEKKEGSFIQTKVIFKDKIIKMDSQIDSMGIAISWLSTNEYHYKSTEVDKTVENTIVIQEKISFWDKLIKNLPLVFLGMVLGLVIPFIPSILLRLR